VLGGGFGGLEAAIYMRTLLPDQADITIVSDKDYFLFKPNTIYIPFGLDPGKLALRLSRPVHRRNISLVNALARDIDPISRRVFLDTQRVSGAEQAGTLSYDFLVMATGAAMRTGEIPGLNPFAHSVWTTDEMLRLRASLHKLVDDAKDGRKKDVLFLVSPGNRCSGPLYEMAMILDTWLRRKKVREQIDITLSTCEEGYIEAFGPALHQAVIHEFEQRTITGHTGYTAERVEQGEAVYKNGESLPFDLLVSFPPIAASSTFSPLPIDDYGFIATDLKTRQVVGYPDIYAVGDASDSPFKQAYLACLQADAAASHLSTVVLGARQPILKSSEMKGLKTELITPSYSSYTSLLNPLWQLGKMALGPYLPWRFKADNPFYSGVPWKVLESGLRLAPGALPGH
jgi:NADH dehydrogenase FAD-containing subunit